MEPETNTEIKKSEELNIENVMGVLDELNLDDEEEVVMDDLDLSDDEEILELKEEAEREALAELNAKMGETVEAKSSTSATTKVKETVKKEGHSRKGKVMSKELIGKLGLDENLFSKRPIQVKIAEKFDNLFFALNGQAKLSTFTVIAIKAIKDNHVAPILDVGHFLNEKIKSSKKNNGETYSSGTASAQAAQLEFLFYILNIVKYSPTKGYIYNDNDICAMIDKYLDAKGL